MPQFNVFGNLKGKFTDLRRNLSICVLKSLLCPYDCEGRGCEVFMSKNAKFYLGMSILIATVAYQEFLSPLFELQPLSFLWFGDLFLKFGALALGLVVASGWRLAMFVYLGLIGIVVATGAWIYAFYIL